MKEKRKRKIVAADIERAKLALALVLTRNFAYRRNKLFPAIFL